MRRKWEEWPLFIAFPLLPLSLTFLSIFVPFLYFLFQPYPSLSFESLRPNSVILYILFSIFPFSGSTNSLFSLYVFPFSC
jgi:hypothetical protein